MTERETLEDKSKLVCISNNHHDDRQIHIPWGEENKLHRWYERL